MARRRTSAFEDLVSLVSRFPWWLGLLLAVVAWFGLHAVAIDKPGPLSVTNPKQFSENFPKHLFRSFALFGQYLVPAICVMGAIMSMAGGVRRRKLMRDVTTASTPGKALEGISWGEFESLVGQVFREKGYSVIETRAGADGGIDLRLRKGNDKYLVQCKHWRAVKVGVKVVREFYGVMVAEGAAGGFIVTSGYFTDDAKSFARGRNLDLVENAELKRWIASAHSSMSGQNPSEADEAPATAPRQGGGPLCPACGGEMQQRTAKRGPNAGGKFWGCTRYPHCRGAMPL